jgi:hypothetical protein
VLTLPILVAFCYSDMNCQKVFGAFFAISSACLGLQTNSLYHNQCVASFNEGTFCYDVNRELTECSEQDNPDFDIEVYFSWRQAGNGLAFLGGVATFAKVLDLICNINIPSFPHHPSPETTTSNRRLRLC